MVVSHAPEASRAGLEILAAGGNAVDAAVATGFALAVVHPSAGNLGGGGFVTIRLANGKTAALDYREIAPRASTRDMFLDSAGKLSKKSVIGHLASGVPGSVAGLIATLDKFGTMKLEQVMAPAIRLARGFVVDSALAKSLRSDSAEICQFAGCATFFPNGRPFQPRDTLRQPDLEQTLQLIAAKGANGFYRGPVARAIVAEMKRGGGIITERDLESYKVAWRKPVVGTYRDHTVISMAPSSSGGTTMIEMFNILEAFGPAAPAASTTALHRLLGAMQLAFIDRNSYLADPDVIKVPVKQLTDKRYAARQRARLDDHRYVSTKSLAPGLDAIGEGTHTTHYSVVDRFGNAVSTTTTVNGSYGSFVWVPGGGFFLNNEMDDFAAQPGTPNMYGLVQGEANAVAPGKRMLSAMSPTIVLDPRGQVLLVIGSAGGPRIITGVAQIILNTIDHRMSLYDAMAAPRVHFQGLPETVAHDRNGLEPSVVDSLTAMGWKFDSGSVSSSNVAIRRVSGGWEGAFDPRTNGGVAGR
jgi:gamma-glutamyltranspeptidase/glutathione hydrolase